MQIDPKKIKNPVHRKLIEHYGNMMASTPLKTQFHKIPELEYEQEALHMKYNLTKYVLDDLVYRYYFDSNNSWLIYGPRADYKSTVALRIKLWNEEIAGLKPDYNDIVDSDVSLLERYTRKNIPRFTTFIKDEWDTIRSGLGNMTVSETVKNVINRARQSGRNLVICTPVFKFYPVDYFLQVWEYVRFKNKCVCCLIYDNEARLKGHVILPMPSDAEIERYQERKKVFMGNMDELKFTVQDELKDIAEKLITDPFSKKTLLGKDGKLKRSASTKNGFITYATDRFPVLQSKTMQKDILEKVEFLLENKLDRFPAPEKE
jgi:hypothetical protein